MKKNNKEVAFNPTTKLESAHLRDVDGHPYLDLTYRTDFPNYSERVCFPHVRLPIDCVPVVDRHVSTIFYDNAPGLKAEAVDLDWGSMTLHCQGEHIFPEPVIFTITRFNERPQEMTIEEIEEKLGYKVKIVSKGE